MVGAVLTCLVLVAAATIFGVVGSIIGIMALSVPVGAVVRTVLVLGTVALVLTTGYRWSRGGPRTLWLVAGLVAYVLLPAAWSGKALIATAFGWEGTLAWVVDALVWMVVVVVTVRSRPAIADERIDTSGLR
ncbi:hypothetical protein O9K63_12280 [Janibacter cremeus]|uniref:hypothetical protein n=1 Tax=Janibacter cremeus TaxID=1285192 RepID=UPI0023F9DA12|nr:hypothetical protein [Janibacter cremeus]WEV77364.1 hypothetical protein O9K63_12280 [Janibacter cremeus]